MKKIRLFLLALLLPAFVMVGCSETPEDPEPEIDNLLTSEYIPDPVFLAYCKKQMTSTDNYSWEQPLQPWDTNGDGKLSSAEAATVTHINILGYDYVNRVEKDDVASLTGIEYFTGLTWLDCSYNPLTSLDVSKNTALTGLQCISNQLTSLDVSNHTALTVLSCPNNQLTSLDVSANTALTYLYCSNNQLTSLDVSKNTALTYLECSNNQLTALDVSKNTALEMLLCDYNQLTSLDISNNTALTYTQWEDNPGDGVSTFPVKAWFDNETIPSRPYVSNDIWIWNNGKGIKSYYYTGEYDGGYGERDIVVWEGNETVNSQESLYPKFEAALFAGLDIEVGDRCV
jgi:Leucine-rich repeat (LRR) protein